MQNEVAVRKKIEDAYRGQDTADLLNHIGWTDNILPKLRQERENFQNLLVNAVLGVEPTIKDHNGAIFHITKEQLAGRVAGLDYIMALMERILTKGDKAIDELRKFGLNL